MVNVGEGKKTGTKYQLAENKKKIGEKYAQKKNSDVEKLTKNDNDEIERKSRAENVAGKVQYNPKIHSLAKKNKHKKFDRFKKRDKQKKIKRKRIEKEKNYVQNYNDLLVDNLIKEFHTTKSPHLVINNKWFTKIKHNVIMLKSPMEIEIESKRRMYYEIDFFGRDVEYTRKGNTWVLNISNTPKNTMYVLVRLNDIFHIPKVQYHTELGKMISKYQLDKDRDHCYVLLSMIHIEKKVKNSPSFVEQNDLQLMKRFLRNQISTTTKNYHFNTTGTIYGFGYGPKSNKNEYGHSVCRFATSKFRTVFFFFFYIFLTLLTFFNFCYFRY